jgi:meiotic recombination protein REC8
VSSHCFPFHFTDLDTVLTSRKYGVATVWCVALAFGSRAFVRHAHLLVRLVATLGQKSALRRVTRKAILEVDVKKACETISTPEAPMALRLQSSLL